MSKREKLLKRFLSIPKDFGWNELISLLKLSDYHLEHGRGSRIRFIHENHPPIILHKPHPESVMKRYQLEQVKETLEKEGVI